MRHGFEATYEVLRNRDAFPSLSAAVPCLGKWDRWGPERGERGHGLVMTKIATTHHPLAALSCTLAALTLYGLDR